MFGIFFINQYCFVSKNQLARFAGVLDAIFFFSFFSASALTLCTLSYQVRQGNVIHIQTMPASRKPIIPKKGAILYFFSNSEKCNGIACKRCMTASPLTGHTVLWSNDEINRNVYIFNSLRVSRWCWFERSHAKSNGHTGKKIKYLYWLINY